MWRRDRFRRSGESWLLGLALSVCVALGLVLVFGLVLPRMLFPPLTERELKGTAPEKWVEAQQAQGELQNAARTPLIQGLGGAAVLVGVYFTFRQLRVVRQGQVTDRFTRAVDQLGSSSMDVQLGGIYALQQISRDSRDERSAISEILAAYVRSHAPWPLPQQKHARNGIRVFGRRADRWERSQDPYYTERDSDTQLVDVDAVERLRERAPGVQAAMLVLGRRGGVPRSEPPLDLIGANLRRIRLSDKYVPGGANLAGALFWRSTLVDAVLRGANLQGAQFGDVDLRQSSLERANFQAAYLHSADLRHVNLSKANLGKADLRNANLRSANLQDARNLDQSNLAGAKANSETRFPDGFSWDNAGVIMDAGS
jgi:hypothetical protein